MGSKERDQLFHYAQGVGGMDRSDYYLDTEAAFDAGAEVGDREGRAAVVSELWARLLDAGVTDEDWNGGDVVAVVDSFLQEHGIDTHAVQCPVDGSSIPGGDDAIREHYRTEHPDDDPVADGLVDPL